MAFVLWLALVQQLVTGQTGPAEPAEWWVTECFFQCEGVRTGDQEPAGQSWWNDWIQSLTEPTAAVQMQQLLYQSEDLRQIHDEWRRFWMNDQPSHMTYQRVHGGMGP